MISKADRIHHFKRPHLKVRGWMILEIFLFSLCIIICTGKSSTSLHPSLMELGIFLGILLLWTAILKNMELSLSAPLFMLNIILLPLWNYLFRGIPLDLNYGIGITLLLCGLILLENPYAEKGYLEKQNRD